MVWLLVDGVPVESGSGSMLGGLVNRNLDPVFESVKKENLPDAHPEEAWKIPTIYCAEKSGVNHI